MLNWVGGRGGADGNPAAMNWSNTKLGARSGEYCVYYRASDMVTPGPAMTFVFVDEPMDRINDGFFVTDMLTNPTTTRMTSAIIPRNITMAAQAFPLQTDIRKCNIGKPR